MMQTNEIDPNEFFGGIDFTDSPSEPKKEQPNEFGGFEEKLNLPLGSTKDALLEAKKQARDLAKKASSIKGELKVIDDKEKLTKNPVMNGVCKSLGITPEVLKSDRERIRTEAFEAYDMAKELMLTLKDQIDNTVTPSDKLWASVSSMLTTLAGTIEKLSTLNTRFRQEMEVEEEKAKVTETADPTASPSEQSMNFSPDQVNEWIAKWSDEQEAESLVDLENTAKSNKNAAEIEMKKNRIGFDGNKQ